MRLVFLAAAAAAAAAQPSADEYERLHTNLPWVRWKVTSEAKRLHKRAHSMVHVGGCVEINQCVGCTR